MAIVEYNGSNNRPTIRDRVTALLARGSAPNAAQPVSLEALEGKSLPLRGSTYAANLPTVRWSASTPLTYFGEGYRLNSAVFACARALAQAFAEPPLMVYSDQSKKEMLPNHPLRKLISRPNPWMGEDEFWRYWLIYSSIAGNAYGYLVPTRGGGVGEIWPYSDLFITPVDSPTEWIDHYEYSTDNGVSKTNIPVEQVVHYKFVPDPFYPMRGMGALRPVAREVDSDNELTRYLKSLLQNDAVPRGVLRVPEGVAITLQQKTEAKENFRRLFGGDNRGDIAVFEKGLTYERMSLDMDELAFDALRGVPEARIAAAFGVPPIVAGLNVGLTRSTYSNYEEARRAFTEQTLVPLWKSVASEIQQSLVPFYGGNIYVDFDLTQVRALQQNVDARMLWIGAMYKAGVLTLNEYRAEAGKEPIEGGDECAVPAPPPMPPAPAAATDMMMDDTNDQGAGNEADKPTDGATEPMKSAGRPHEVKALSASQERAAKALEKKLTGFLEKEYGRIADHLEAA